MKHLINHPQFGQIRVEMVKNEPWFCAKDVCDILDHSNNAMLYKSLDDDEKGIRKVYTLGGYQDIMFVNESGLYALIIRSNKPEAKKFRKWVTADVLPAIRKYGTYSTDAKVMENAKKRLEQKGLRDFRTSISKNLSTTDKRLIAKQCLTSEYELNKVLNGQKEDTHMMSLLYAKAVKNKDFRVMFYTLEGAENLIQEINKPVTFNN